MIFIYWRINKNHWRILFKLMPGNFQNLMNLEKYLVCFLRLFQALPADLLLPVSSEVRLDLFEE